jgi:hypothetical protein
VLPGVSVVVDTRGRQFPAITAGDGSFLIAGLPHGIANLTASLAGFNTVATSFVVGDIGHKADITLTVGSMEETVTVSGASPRVNRNPDQKVAPSQNVIDLQRRVAGVLPIRVDVPRAGSEYHFSRALVVNDETRVSFRYKRK